ncbi:MAG TPA: hypothetical protein VKT77_22145 [Chthonomonadaceae bacterium]|nr:hypothetical protein [Chthonomonadaceae bacterium]
MAEADSVRLCRDALVATGLSDSGVLDSAGVDGLSERVERGLLPVEVVLRYATDLRALSEATGLAGAAIPVQFWGVCSPAMQSAGLDEFTLTHLLAQAEYRPYVELLARCFARLVALKTGTRSPDAAQDPRATRAGEARAPKSEPAAAEPGITSVGTALAILREAAEFVRGGAYPSDVSPITDRDLAPEPRAILLWQQILTGTNRQIPYVHRDAYTHGAWARFNVVEMWRYRVGRLAPVDEVWGLTGFSQRFLGDAGNTNQIEHMAISAVAQSVLRLPVWLLNIVEELEWILRQGTRAASKADEQLNLEVARVLLPNFRVDDPDAACRRLEQALLDQ